MRRMILSAILLAGCAGPTVIEDLPFEQADPADIEGSGVSTEPIPICHLPAPPPPPSTVESAPVDTFTRFVDRLLGLEDGERERVDIVLVGDSHIASDTLSHRLRVLLQERYGNGGRGFAYPGEPWDGFRQRRMRYGMSGDWETESGARRTWSPPLGLGGVRLHSSSAGAQVWRQAADEDAESLFDQVAIHYLLAPDGGSFDVSVDSTTVEHVDTRADGERVGVLRITLPERSNEVRIEVLGDGEVSLFGIATESLDGGVIVDSLGINGARATQFLAFDETLTRDELAARDPAAYIVAFGTNEAYGSSFRQEPDEAPGEADERAAGYAADFGALLDRYAAAAPDAACIVLLPPDFNDDEGRCVERSWSSGARCNELDGCSEAHDHEFCVLETPDSLARVADAQRRAAAARGCAVWDQQQAMGGPGSHSAWQQWDPQLAAGDGVHLTGVGYDRLAEGFFADLDAAVRLRRAGASSAVLQTTAVFPPHGDH